MKFTFDGRQYSYGHQLNADDVHATKLAHELHLYTHRLNTCTIENGKVVHSPRNASELAKFLSVTSYSLTDFILGLKALDADGWELDPMQFQPTNMRFSYNVTLVRKQESIETDRHIITQSLPPKVTQYLLDFEAAKATGKAEEEQRIQDRLDELTSRESEKRNLRRQLQQIRGEEHETIVS